MFKSEKKHIRFYSGLSLVLCFFVFPAFLFLIAFDNFVSYQKTNSLKESQSKSRHLLIDLKVHSDGQKYFDLVFNNFFNEKRYNADYEKTLRSNIQRLKNAFPESLEFVVWNKSGNLDKKLSDNPRYIFFLKKLNRYLSELYEIAIKDFPGEPYIPVTLKKQARNFKQLLGPFIPASALTNSFMPSRQRRCFQMHGKGKQAYGWFSKNKNFSILIYISNKAVNSFHGAKAMCAKLNKRNTNTKLFLLDERKKTIYPSTSPQISRQLFFNQKRFTELNPADFLTDDRFLYSYQNLRENLWGVVIKEIQGINEQTDRYWQLFARIIGAIFLFLIILQVYFLVHSNPFVAIRWKLYFVFFYTIGLPMLIFAVIGYEYLTQKQSQIQTDFANEILENIDEFDSKFENYQNKLAENLTNELEKCFEENATNHEKAKPFYRKLQELKSKYRFSAFLVADREGKSIFPEHSDQAAEITFLKNISEDVLDYLNDRKLKEIKQIKVLTQSSLASYEKSNRKILINYFGLQPFYVYWLTPFNKATKSFSYFVHIFWDVKSLQNEYYKDSSFSRLNKDTKLFFSKTGSFSDGSLPDKNLESFFRKTEDTGTHYEIAKLSNNKDFLIVGKKGKLLEESIITVFVNKRLIDNELALVRSKLKTSTMLAVLFSLCLFFILGVLILNPIQSLVTGTEKIRKKQFNHRIELEAKNEFGRLAHSLNETLENLQEFAIAKVVQESLLPEENYYLSENFALFGRSNPMTKLGGDYYEFFEDDKGVLNVLVADVAGHGIQAALMMAMAKTAFYLAKKETSDAKLIMEKMNETFYKIRRSSIRTMMTCLMISLDPATGKFRYMNAGHCSPVILSKSGDDARFLVQEDFPLGFARARKFNPEIHCLEHGETLLLYTDGFLENHNIHGQMLGLEGFLGHVRQSFAHDISEVYQKLYSHYEAWSREQEDDVTLILIKRKRNDNE